MSTVQTEHSTLTQPLRRNAFAGWGSGAAGMLIFSGSLPATRLGLQGFSPLFLTFARAGIAGLIGLSLLLLLRQRRPQQSDVLPLLTVALGVVVGFPLLTALALQHISAAHATVFIGLLPLSTALFGVIRGGERPALPFWLSSIAGSAIMVAYALHRDGDGSLLGDGLMVAAILVCGLGYAEGAKLSRRLGGWQVISWALVLALPIMLPAALITQPTNFAAAPLAAWGGLAYVTLFSMLIGFVFWYRGLALGGIAAVGQLQLLQPFFGLAFAALLLHDTIPLSMVGVTLAIVVCVACARRFARAPTRVQ